MTVDELLALLSPTTLINLIIDLDDADMTRDEVHVVAVAIMNARDVLGDKYYDRHVIEKERRQNVVRSVR